MAYSLEIIRHRGGKGREAEGIENDDGEHCESGETRAGTARNDIKFPSASSKTRISPGNFSGGIGSLSIDKEISIGRGLC
jgi:hypothetical protein